MLLCAAGTLPCHGSTEVDAIMGGNTLGRSSVLKVLALPEEPPPEERAEGGIELPCNEPRPGPIAKEDLSNAPADEGCDNPPLESADWKARGFSMMSLLVPFKLSALLLARGVAVRLGKEVVFRMLATLFFSFNTENDGFSVVVSSYVFSSSFFHHLSRLRAGYG